MSQLVIQNVKVYNFVHIEEADLDLGPDIFFITGENRDEASSGSNGSGKSTLLQLIAWGLFEESPRKAMLKDGVIGKYGKYAQVVLTLEKDGRTIVIDRVRNHPTRKHDVSIHIDGDVDSAMHSKSDSNSFIESLLGISSKVFYYCAYADGDKEPLVALSSARLNQVVSEILDTQRFDTYIKKIRDVKRKSSTSLQELRRDVVEIENKILEHNSNLAFYESELADFDSNRREKVKALMQELDALKEERDSYTELLDGGEEIEQSYKRLKEEVKAIDKAKSDLANLKNKCRTAATSVASRSARVTKAEAERIKCEESYDNIFNNASGSCNYCGNILHDSSDLSTHSELAVRRMDEAKAALVEANVDLEVALAAETRATAELEAKEKEVEGMQELATEFFKAERQMDAFARVVKSAAGLDRSIVAKQKEVAEAKSSSPVGMIQRRDRTVDEMNIATENLEIAMQQLEAADVDVQACACLEDALKVTKAGLFNSFMIDLLGKINANFDEISGGDMHCTLEKDGDELEVLFTNTSKEGQYFPYWIFSRGEKAKISKAAAAALNELMGVGLMIDDEGLDGVDDAGSGPLLDFIIKQNEGKSLFFVSHSSGVKDYFRGYKNIHVVKENGRATMEVRNVES